MRLQSDPNTDWRELEKLDMGALIPALKRTKVITRDEELILNDFSKKLRNPYLHFNIYELISSLS